MTKHFRTSAVALLSGLAVCASLPPWGWWPLAALGIAGWSLILRDASPRARGARSALVAVGWFVPSLAWMASFTPPGYIAAVIVFAVLYGLAGVLVTSGMHRFVLLPAAIVAIEWIRWHAPFGGVPLSSLSLSQATGPLLPLARVGGPLLIDLAVATVGVAAAYAFEQRTRAGLIRAGMPIAAVVAVAFASVFAPAGDAIGNLDVAVVQGGGPQGTLALNTDPADPFEAHLAASRTITKPVDAVIWPENVVNVNGPLIDHPWADDLAAEARRVGAPIELGVVEGVDDEHFVNYSVVVEADGTFNDRYDKVRRVPFGEYVPMRSIFAPFSELLPRRDQIPGTGPARLEVGTTQMAVAISWEIFFPRRVREGVLAGGEVVLNPTNGSSYSLTLVQSQQVASSILRATESGRYVLQAAPTGFSAVIDHNGTLLQRTGVSERKVLYATIERREGLTIAVRTGDAIALFLAAGAAGYVLYAMNRSRRRRGADPDSPDSPEAPESENGPVAELG